MSFDKIIDLTAGVYLKFYLVSTDTTQISYMMKWLFFSAD